MTCLMQLVLQDENGRAIRAVRDFSLDLQYGDGDCDFELYIPNTMVKPRTRFVIDGTSFGGIITKRNPISDSDGDSITWKGRTVQGVMASHYIEPPAGKTHYVVSGDANKVIEQVISAFGLSDYFETSKKASGISIVNYSFNRWVDVWTGLRMMLAKHDARISISCGDGKHLVEAVPSRSYGRLDSERVYFDLDIDDLPVNHLIGLGKGEGLERAVVHWYADTLGNVSKSQTLFGILENALTYQLTSEEEDTLDSKAKSKLLELQNSNEATFSLPPGSNLDVGDIITLSNAKFNLSAQAEITQIILKASLGVSDIQCKCGMPDYPKDED